MPTDQKYELYLRDLAYLLKESTVEAKSTWLEARGTEKEPFATGYLMGFHRVITLMQQQAVAFGIPNQEFGLTDIDESYFFNDAL